MVYFDGGIFQMILCGLRVKLTISTGINFDIQLTDNFNLVLDYHDHLQALKEILEGVQQVLLHLEMDVGQLGIGIL